MAHNSYHYMSPAQFLETFGPALQDYLEQSYGKEEDTHVSDMLAHTGAFFDAAYHTVSSFLYTVDKKYYADTTSSDDVPEEEVK